MKLLLQNNIASHYRAAIYQLIDKELGCDFCFGDKFDGIKKLYARIMIRILFALKQDVLVSGCF